MSKQGVGHHHSSVLFDVQIKTFDELEELYGIEVYEDGSVYDPCEDRDFDTLSEWAKFVDEQEKADNAAFEKRGKQSYYDDDE